MAEEKVTHIDSIAVVLEVFPHEHPLLLRLVIKDHDYPVVALLDTSIDREQWEALESKASKILRRPELQQYAPTIDAEKVDKLLADKDEEVKKLRVELEKAQARASGLTDVLGTKDRLIYQLNEQVGEEKAARLCAQNEANKARRASR